jgi:AcrR family transcriptional regulator
VSTQPSGDAVEEEGLRAADGRVPGRRGRATRQKLLECTAAMLTSSSYREVKVVDIAREAGTSPGTFYQYFPDVESAILAVAEDMVAEGEGFADIVRATRWRGQAGYDGALQLADAFITFWEEHQPVLRVVDLVAEEGDLRFGGIRTRLLNALFNALSEAVADAKKAGRHPAHVDPRAQAGVLVAMLAQVAAHRFGFEFWGMRTADLRTSMARILYSSVTGQKPPA